MPYAGQHHSLLIELLYHQSGCDFNTCFGKLCRTFLFDLHHRDVLGSHSAFVQHHIPDLCHLCRCERFTGGHHGKVCRPDCKKHRQSAKPLALISVSISFSAFRSSRFAVIWAVYSFFSSAESDEDFIVFLMESIASSWAFCRLSRACSKNFAPLSLATLTAALHHSFCWRWTPLRPLWAAHPEPSAPVPGHPQPLPRPLQHCPAVPWAHRCGRTASSSIRRSPVRQPM